MNSHNVSLHLLLFNEISFGLEVFLGFGIWLYFRDKVTSVADKYLTFGPRFCAAIVDGGVMLPFAILVNAAHYAKCAAGVIIAATIIRQAAGWVYSVGMNTKYGQTVGKVASKVRIVDAKRELPITFGQALLRDLPSLILIALVIPREMRVQLKIAHDNSAAIPYSPFDITVRCVTGLWFIAEVVTMFCNEKRRAIHDFIAGTVVVRTNLEEEGEG